MKLKITTLTIAAAFLSGRSAESLQLLQRSWQRHLGAGRVELEDLLDSLRARFAARDELLVEDGREALTEQAGDGRGRVASTCQPSRQILQNWRLTEGESEVTRYRLIVYTGQLDPTVLHRAWTAYAGGSR